MTNIRVLVVDDHPLMREALIAALTTEPDMEVAGEAATGQEAVEQAQALQPDVIIMDLLMPGVDGIEAIATIQAELPRTRILAITSSIDGGRVLDAVRAGALGYLLKDVRRGELIRAIREVNRGTPYLPPQVALQLIQGVRQLPPQAPPSPQQPTIGHDGIELTSRQKEVFILLGQGLSNREIADKLVVSQVTVRSHIYHILGKLGLHNRSQAVAYAVREGLPD
ncbi:MAG: response regulator transcription factor [Chloroflexi bacterium]|nr:response regulator transcription factor [Chloroflexota bacterium]